MISWISGPNVLSLPNVVALELDRLKACGQETHTRMGANSSEGELPSLPGCKGAHDAKLWPEGWLTFQKGGAISELTSLALLPRNGGGRHVGRVDTTHHVRVAASSSSMEIPHLAQWLQAGL